MNLPAANSGGSAGPVPPPPPHEFFLVLPDGSCIPATARNCRTLMKQVRSEARQQARIKRLEKAAEIQMALEDRAAARRLLQELAEIDRDRIRYAARFRVRIKPERPPSRTSPVRKRVIATAIKAPRHAAAPRPASSWAVDDLGMRGIMWQQSYLGRSSPGFHRGAARANWEYDVRDEAVLLDAAGDPVIISNMGDDWIEIGAAWQALEDASTRKNAKIQIRAIAPFDADMSEAEMIGATKHFCETILGPLGLSYSAVIHSPSDNGDERNFHPHISFGLRPMRRVEPYCWEVADTVRGELDGRDGVQMLRHLWAHAMSEAAARAGRGMTYTGLGYGARGLDLEAGEHLGEARSAMVARGEQVWAWERNRIKAARNASRRAIRDAERKIAALTSVREAVIAQKESCEGTDRKRIVRVSPPARERTYRRAWAAPVASQQRITAGKIGEPPSRRASVRPVVPVRRPTTSASVSADPVRRVVTRPVAERPVRHMTARSEEHTRAAVARASKPTSRFSEWVAPGSSAPVHRRASSVGALPDRNREWTIARTAVSARRLPASPSEGPALQRSPGFMAKPKTGEPRQASTSRSNVAPDPIVEQVRAMLALLHREQESRAERRAKVRNASRRAALPADDLPSDPVPHGARGGQSAPSAAPDDSGPPASSESLEAAASLRAARWRRARMADHPVHARDGSDDIATRAWLEQHPRRSRREPQEAATDHDRLVVDRLKKVDPYVADRRDGTFSVDERALAAVGASPCWVATASARQALAAIRADQQEVMTALAADAEQGPLAFARTGTRFWPRDLAPALRDRLDRWSSDPGFQDDIFPIEQAVRAAYLAHDKEERERSRKRDTGCPAPSAPFVPVPDGFGSMRTSPPPVFTPHAITGRWQAFDPATEMPSEQLVMLVELVARKPQLVDRASDGRLMALPGASPVMADLLTQWRHDLRVDDLVTRTATASRQAGSPVLPPEIAAPIPDRRIGTNPPPPDLSRGPGR